MIKCQKMMLWCIVGSIVFFTGSVTGSSTLGIIPFTISDTIQDSTKTEFHTHLFNRLQFELLPGGIKPQIVNDSMCENCSVLVGGTIERSGEMSILRFTISNKTHTEVDQKVIPLSGYSRDDVTDLCILKIRHYLEQNYMVKLRVSSKPLDCELFLNGIKVGKTPSELILEKGKYNLTLEHDFCRPYHDTVLVSPGSNIDIDATLKFSGYRYKPFVYSTLCFTIATVILWTVENRYHNDYNKLGSTTPDYVFSDYFNRYQTVYYCRIGVLNAAILSGAVSGYLTFKNVGLKKKLFTESKNH